MKKFNEEYFKIITESKIILNSLKPITRGTPDIEQVKSELLKLFKFSYWKDFVDMQKTGQCDFISKVVCRLFPKFQMVSVIVDFSEDAIKRLGDEDAYASHFLNKLGNTYYDFGKGTNRYSGVYILKGLGDIYDVNLTEWEASHLRDEIKINPKEIGTMVR